MSKLQELLRQADAYKEIIQKADTHSDKPIETAELQTTDITENLIKDLHRTIYSGTDSSQAGRYRTFPAKDPDADFLPPSPEDLPRLMSHLENQIHSSKSALHPVELAAMAQKRLIEIHPFADGNEKTAEALGNLILSRSGYCPVTVPACREKDFLDALASSRRSSDMEPLSILHAELVIEALRNHIRSMGISL